MDFCEIEASVNTGLEEIAKSEVFEKFNVTAKTSMGRVNFNMRIEDVKQILTLSSCDNLSVILKCYDEFEFSDDNKINEMNLEKLVDDIDWQKGIKIWSLFTDYSGSPVSHLSNDVNAADLKYRARCYRSGENHAFGSQDIATWFGSSMQDFFGWTVNLSNYDIEVLLTIQNNYMRIGVALTKQSLHRRNIVNFGPTTLRPTIAYGMLRMCNIQKGDIVCDAMCGGGSIPIEAALNWTECLHLAGDYNDLSIERVFENVNAINAKPRITKKLNIDILQWDVTNLPLRDKTIDVFITDMPFGKRSGKKRDNKVLYREALKEMGRCAIPNVSRCCILTHDKRNLFQALKAHSSIWHKVKFTATNMGGLPAAIFILKRI